MWDAPPPLEFARRLARSESGVPAVIAEVKKASPSKGIIRPDFDPEAIARSYEAAGAAAISVLTDTQFFQGSLGYLRQVKQAVSLPILRKDFIIDEYQVYEARAAGADAILLIVAALERDTLVDLMNRATEIGMQYLVEVHDEAEMRAAIDVCAPIIGINNRNLQTFEVSLDTTESLMRTAERARMPEEPASGAGMPRTIDEMPRTIKAGKAHVAECRTQKRGKFVSESGIFTRDDMTRLGAMGVDAVLIGEALMREADIEAKLRELTQ